MERSYGWIVFHQRRLIIYLTVMDYYLSGRKQFTISREFNALFMSTPTWKDITIRFNTHYVKASTHDMGRGYGSSLCVIGNVVSLTATGTHLFRQRTTIYGEVGALFFSAVMRMDDTIRMRTRRSNHQHVWVYGIITKNYISFFMRVPKSRVLRCNGWIADFVFRKRKRWVIDIKEMFPKLESHTRLKDKTKATKHMIRIAALQLFCSFVTKTFDYIFILMCNITVFGSY